MHRRLIQLAAVHVALVAILFHALIPAGWMPNVSEPESTPLVICTVHGSILIHARSGRDLGDFVKHKPARDDGNHNDVCPFAVAVHFATHAGVISLTAPRHVGLIEQPDALLYGALLRDHHAPQAPRAPPTFG